MECRYLERETMTPGVLIDVYHEDDYCGYIRGAPDSDVYEYFCCTNNSTLPVYEELSLKDLIEKIDKASCV